MSEKPDEEVFESFEEPTYSDEKPNKSVDEAGWTNAKMAQSQAHGDAWKDAQKAANKPKPPQKLNTQHPGTYEPIQHTDTEPSGLELANEMGGGGSGAANVAGFQAPLTDEERMAAVKEMIKSRVKEVVRKKAGGGGYTLYGPNKGKKGKPKPSGTFPTKVGAKRAELARYPPKDPGKLKRLRKEVDKLAKDPKKAAEKEKNAKKAKGTDKGSKKEGLVREAPGTPFAPASSPPGAIGSTPQIHKDLKTFASGLKAIPQTDTAKRGKYVQDHLSNPEFMKALQTQEPDQTKRQSIMNSLYSIANKGARPGGNNKVTTGTGSTNPASMAQAAESVSRRMDFMERVILSKVITKSLTESLFREEATESEWDDYIGKLSKNALAGDGKFQTLQKNISRRTDDILKDAFDTIRKAVGKNVKMKSYGVKHDPQSGKTYLAFSATFEDVSVEPMYIHVEGGVPKIELSSGAKVALTKVDPDKGKLFRAELVTVQERVLDEMDDLSKAIQNRDKYLQKMENEVDGYVAGLSPLQISLLKQLLVKKYRKIS